MPENTGAVGIIVTENLGIPATPYAAITKRNGMIYVVEIDEEQYNDIENGSLSKKDSRNPIAEQLGLIPQNMKKFFDLMPENRRSGYMEQITLHDARYGDGANVAGIALPWTKSFSSFAGSDSMAVLVHETGHMMIDDEKNVLHVIDKICDHAGGRLIHKGDNAVCPMHGWKLDLHTLKYQDSHIEKSSAQYSMVNGKLLIPDNLSYLENPYRVDNHLEVNFRFLNHATVAIFFNEITLITDPWLFGPAFMTGWWLDQPSTEDSIEILQNADYIFISHNHPDHLHSQTLELLKKDQKNKFYFI